MDENQSAEKMMTNEEILREIDSLPLEARRQIEDFVSFLRERYKSSQQINAPTSDLETEAFVGQNTIEKPSGCAVEYTATRLCFKADLIEPLSRDQKFCVRSGVGTFIMTKGQFYETFPNVPETLSYREQRIYHYPKLPKKALQFKVDNLKTV